MKYYFLPLFFLFILNPVLCQTIVGSSHPMNLPQTKSLMISGGIGIQTFDNYEFDEDEENESVEEIEYDLISFPNPSNNYFTFGATSDAFKETKYDLQIFTVSGMLIKTIKRVAIKELIDVTDLSEGLYIIKLLGINTEEEKGFKFIKRNK